MQFYDDTFRSHNGDLKSQSDSRLPYIPHPAHHGGMKNDMECILATDFGAADKVLTKGTQPRPELKAGSKQVLIRVSACSVTPGDYRMMSGAAKFVKKPRNGFPYIPGLDVSGVVEESDSEEFSTGDRVVATWDVYGEGGMAEYALVDAVRCVKLLEGITPVHGAALANSASHAVKAVREAKVGPGSRVLVLGGTGGVGQAVVQLARVEGATFIAATGTQTELLRRIGVDVAIDYTEKHWSDAGLENLDAVIDCAEGAVAWTHPALTKVLKRNGRFVAVVIHEWDMQFNSILGLFPYLGRAFGRSFRAFVNPSSPSYTVHLDGPDKSTMNEVMELTASGKLKVYLHNDETFEFSEEGAKSMFQMLISRRAHGKLVMQIS